MDKEQEARLLNKLKQNKQINKSYLDTPFNDLLVANPEMKALFDYIDNIGQPFRKIQVTSEKYKKLFRSIDTITYSFLETMQSLENITKPINEILPPKFFNTIELIKKQHVHVFMDLYKIDVHITNIRKNSTNITNDEINLILQTLDEKDSIIIAKQNEINQLKEENQVVLSTNETLKLILQQNICLINKVDKLQTEIEILKQAQNISLADKTTEQKNNIPQEILGLSDTYQKSYKIIALYPYESRVSLARKRNLALPTFKNHIETLCQALGIDNGITKLREYLNTKTSIVDIIN